MEKLQTLIILAAVIAGLIIGQNITISSYAGYTITAFLFLMLYGLFLNIPLKDLKKGFLNAKFAAISLSINFIWTPALAWLLGAVFLAEEPALWIGFIMLMVTPCTDWYLMFTGIAKGNVPLSASILPVNLILQIILLPIYLLLFAGVMGTFQMSVLFESVLIVLVIPFLLAQLTKFLLAQCKASVALKEKITGFFGAGQIVFLSLAIVAMFASQGKYLFNNIQIVFVLLIPVLLFFVINFLVAFFAGRLFKLKFDDYVSLSLTTLARNSPISLAIAVMAFPQQPLIALALVIGPLIELPVLAVISQLLLFMRPKMP